MLLRPENKDELAAILTYHVVSGKVKAKDAVKITSATTVEGSKAGIMIKSGGVVFNGKSNVDKTDIMTSIGSFM